MPKVKTHISIRDRFQDEELEDDAFLSDSKNGHPPLQRNAANARERARMRVLSSAFGRLKTKLPNIPPDTKLSKLDTLRLATIYIKQLKALTQGIPEVNDDDDTHNYEMSLQNENITNLHYQNSSVTWPLAFQHIHQTNRILAPRLTTEDAPECIQSNHKHIFSSTDIIENNYHFSASSSSIGGNNLTFDYHEESQQELNSCISQKHYKYNSNHCAINKNT